MFVIFIADWIWGHRFVFAIRRGRGCGGPSAPDKQDWSLLLQRAHPIKRPKVWAEFQMILRYQKVRSNQIAYFILILPICLLGAEGT